MVTPIWIPVTSCISGYTWSFSICSGCGFPLGSCTRHTTTSAWRLLEPVVRLGLRLRRLHSCLVQSIAIHNDSVKESRQQAEWGHADKPAPLVTRDAFRLQRNNVQVPFFRIASRPSSPTVAKPDQSLPHPSTYFSLFVRQVALEIHALPTPKRYSTAASWRLLQRSKIAVGRYSLVVARHWTLPCSWPPSEPANVASTGNSDSRSSTSRTSSGK